MINRDELLKMAREAHGPITGEWFDMDIAALDRLKDAILERAALECEKIQRNDLPTAAACFGADKCADSIRALKTQGE